MQPARSTEAIHMDMDMDIDQQKQLLLLVIYMNFKLRSMNIICYSFVCLFKMDEFFTFVMFFLLHLFCIFRWWSRRTWSLFITWRPRRTLITWGIWHRCSNYRCCTWRRKRSFTSRIRKQLWVSFLIICLNFE